jgi:polyisoprenoid-binding protein YceI
MTPEAARDDLELLIPPGVWEVDPVHSALAFEVHDMQSLVATVSGRFLEFEATLEGGADPRAKATIRVASVDTGNAERDQDLRSADFFDADAYPEIRFRTTAIDGRGDGRFAVVGALEIQGASYEVSLEGRALGHGPDRQGDERVALEARGGFEWAENEVRLIANVSAKKAG